LSRSVGLDVYVKDCSYNCVESLTGDGANYRGCKAKTVTGRTC